MRNTVVKVLFSNRKIRQCQKLARSWGRGVDRGRPALRFSSSRLFCRLLGEGVGAWFTATCNINTTRKKETETVQKIRVSSRERQGDWTPGCWEPVLLTIDHYQCAVKIEWGPYSKAAKRKINQKYVND